MNLSGAIMAVCFAELSFHQCNKVTTTASRRPVLVLYGTNSIFPPPFRGWSTKRISPSTWLSTWFDSEKQGQWRELAVASSRTALNIRTTRIDYEDFTTDSTGVVCAGRPIIPRQCCPLPFWGWWWPGHRPVYSDWRCGNLCSVGMDCPPKSQQLSWTTGIEHKRVAGRVPASHMISHLSCKITTLFFSMHQWSSHSSCVLFLFLLAAKCLVIPWVFVVLMVKLW